MSLVVSIKITGHLFIIRFFQSEEQVRISFFNRAINDYNQTSLDICRSVQYQHWLDSTFTYYTTFYSHCFVSCVIPSVCSWLGCLWYLQILFFFIVFARMPIMFSMRKIIFCLWRVSISTVTCYSIYIHLLKKYLV